MFIWSQKWKNSVWVHKWLENLSKDYIPAYEDAAAAKRYTKVSFLAVVSF